MWSNYFQSSSPWVDEAHLISFRLLLTFSFRTHETALNSGLCVPLTRLPLKVLSLSLNTVLVPILAIIDIDSIASLALYPFWLLPLIVQRKLKLSRWYFVSKYTRNDMMLVIVVSIYRWYRPSIYRWYRSSLFSCLRSECRIRLLFVIQLFEPGDWLSVISRGDNCAIIEIVIALRL
jgi:hypothetical protein